MYRREIFSILVIPIVGVINISLASTFHVFKIPLKSIDSRSYCARLEEKLQTVQGSILLLEISRPSQVFDVVRSAQSERCDQPDNANEAIAFNVTDLIRMIHDSKVTVQSHKIVDHVTLHTPEGEFLLTVERTGEIQPPGVQSRIDGLTSNEKLLLSLIGGGRIGRLQRQKKSP